MLAVTPLRSQEYVLDLGCGYGLVGVYMGKLFGARQVVMSDIDPLTVEVARRNAVLNDLSEIPVILSDGFEAHQRERLHVDYVQSVPIMRILPSQGLIGDLGDIWPWAESW